MEVDSATKKPSTRYPQPPVDPPPSLEPALAPLPAYIAAEPLVLAAAYGRTRGCDFSASFKLERVTEHLAMNRIVRLRFEQLCLCLYLRLRGEVKSMEKVIFVVEELLRHVLPYSRTRRQSSQALKYPQSVYHCSGGFETIPGTLTSCIGSLCTPEGKIFQERAYADIKRHYPDIRDAWKNSYQEEKIPYLRAIIQEAGRYYTVSSMSLPRKTVTEVNWNGAIIPPKTMILVNAQAGNHDVDHFGPDAGIFNPGRWLEPITEQNHMGPFVETPLVSQAHLSFGAGARACSGQLIAQRLLYAALIRILSSYQIVASKTQPPNTDYVDYNQCETALVAIPREFKVRLIPRDKPVMEDLLRAAYERTQDHHKEEIRGFTSAP
ncbi:hypothetical protein BST61_g2938 [Cercospora zeina]